MLPLNRKEESASFLIPPSFVEKERQEVHVTAAL
jgi:hypothetical protein